MFPLETRILLVDDVLNMTHSIRSVLQKVGYRKIMTAQSGEEAFALLVKQFHLNDPIGLVLCDWNMEGMNGLELLLKVRANRELKDIPFIMITAEGSTNHVLKAAQAGVDNYITKPLTAATLKDKIQKVWLKKNSPPK